MAREFPGRTDNSLKNFFYSSVRRAIRQLNSFLTMHKRRTNIKPFKLSILTKLFKINDPKFRVKLDIKTQRADELAKSNGFPT
jgi:hypothetical protein